MIALPLWASRLLAGGLSILTAGVTVPVWLIGGAYLWTRWDKTSAVRLAVNGAVTSLVNGAELEAAREREKAMRVTIDALTSAQYNLSKANEVLNERIQNESDQNTELEARIQNLQSADRCPVSDDVFRMLNNR